jgi:hypothetical protein
MPRMTHATLMRLARESEARQMNVGVYLEEVLECHWASLAMEQRLRLAERPSIKDWGEEDTRVYRKA